MANNGKAEQDPRTNLIINYLPQNMSDKELSSMFITIGPLKSARIMRDGKTGYSYGFGFVDYMKPEDATKAINTLNGLQIMNKTIKVSYARPPGEDIKGTNLYISNLPKDMTQEYLDSMFAPYGTIVQSNLLKDKNTGLPRGIAFVRFDKKSEASTAIQALNGSVPKGGIETITVKVAEEHGKQKAAFYAGWQASLNQSGGSTGNDRQSSNPRSYGHPMRAMANSRQVWQHGEYPHMTQNVMPHRNPGVMRNERSGNRYNPIGMGGGYSNMYNWN